MGAGPRVGVTEARWSDAVGAAVPAPEPPAGGAFYGPLGDWQKGAYERNAFAQGAEQEVAFLADALGLAPDAGLVVDVGCGTGRHARRLAREGVAVVGVDLSHGLLTAARAAAPGLGWVRADARRLPLPDGCAAAVLSLCQGAFGITPGGDAAVLAEIVRILRPGGRLALTAFSLAFAARWIGADDALDVGRGLHHNTADVRNADGESRSFDLWTSCFSAGELRLLATAAGLRVDVVAGVSPGDFGVRQPLLCHPELLLLASRS